METVSIQDILTQISMVVYVDNWTILTNTIRRVYLVLESGCTIIHEYLHIESLNV